MLIMAKDGAIAFSFSPNMSWPHAIEFVRRRMTGKLPDGAWVGTVSKMDEDEIAAISSKYFFWLSTSRTRLGYRPRSEKQILSDFYHDVTIRRSRRRLHYQFRIRRIDRLDGAAQLLTLGHTESIPC